MTAAPLVCTKDEQRYVVHFYRQMVCKVLTVTCVCVRTLGTMLFLGKVYNRREVLKKSQTDVTDKECSGCLSTWTNNKDIWSCQSHGSWGEESLLRKWRRNLVLSRGHCIQECTTAVGSTGCVQNGFAGNWQKSLSTLFYGHLLLSLGMLSQQSRELVKLHHHRAWNLDIVLQTQVQVREHVVETHSLTIS
jgi:hypothetical protein